MVKEANRSLTDYTVCCAVSQHVTAVKGSALDR